MRGHAETDEEVLRRSSDAYTERYWNTISHFFKSRVTYSQIPADTYYIFTQDEEKGYLQDLVIKQEKFKDYEVNTLTDYSKDVENGYQYLRVLVTEKKHKDDYAQFLIVKSLAMFSFNDEAQKFEK